MELIQILLAETRNKLVEDVVISFLAALRYDTTLLEQIVGDVTSDDVNLVVEVNLDEFAES